MSATRMEVSLRTVAGSTRMVRVQRKQERSTFMQSNLHRP